MEGSTDYPKGEKNVNKLFTESPNLQFPPRAKLFLPDISMVG